jgi:RNA polymerase sigma factor (sigma-70 family)
MLYSEITDGQLLNKWLSGDKNGFEEIVRRYGAMVFGVCRRIAGWLFRTARFTSMNVVRSEQARKYHETESYGKRINYETDKTMNKLEQDEIQSKLDQAIERLPAKYRSVIISCYLEGLTHEEAGRRLGLSRGMVSVYVQRGLEKLRRLLPINEDLPLTALGTWLLKTGKIQLPTGLSRL